MDYMNEPAAPNMSEEASTNNAGRRKLRRSCETCRSSKGKCIPSEQSGRCQRCAKEGQQCTFLEAKPRPKRAKNSRLRVAEMEEKLDGLMALLVARQSGKEASPSESSAPSQPAPALSPQETLAQTFTHPISSSVSSVSLSRSDGSRHQHSLPLFSFTDFDTFNDVISKGFVTSSQAEEFVRYFQSRASNFPFVLVPPKMNLDSLRRERPFLLLAILSFAAHKNEKLQDRLDIELRESLSRRVIVNCEKSIDTLQGLLVYLAWYHFYFEPYREQVYQLSQMAAAMAIDLGINKPTQDAMPNDFRLMKRSLLPQSSEDLEAQRTFLGCYYLTTSICQGLRKSSMLKYCDYMGTCGESLARAAVAETDYLLLYFIRLQRLAEDIDYAFDYSNTLTSSPLDTLRIEILLKGFEQQLNQFELTFPQHVWNNPSLTLRFYNLRAYINEIGLHAARPPGKEMIAHSWYYSTLRSESLIRCLQATKSYLDRYLLLTTEEMANLNMTDYIHSVYAILVLGAFAAGAYDCDTLDCISIKQTANLEYYLDSLSFQALQLLAVSEPSSNNYISHLHSLFQQSKVWYTQLVKDPTPIGICITGRPTFSFLEIIPTIMSRCADFSGTFSSGTSDISSPVGGSRLSEVGSDERWSEMLSSWAANQDLSTMVLDNALV